MIHLPRVPDVRILYDRDEDEIWLWSVGQWHRSRLDEREIVFDVQVASSFNCLSLWRLGGIRRSEARTMNVELERRGSDYRVRPLKAFPFCRADTGLNSYEDAHPEMLWRTGELAA